MAENRVRDWSRLSGWALTAFLAAHLVSGQGLDVVRPVDIFGVTMILSVGWGIVGAAAAVVTTLLTKSRSTTLTPFWNMRTGPSLLFVLGIGVIMAMKPFHNELPIIVIVMWMAGNALLMAIAGKGRDWWGKPIAASIAEDGPQFVKND